MMKRRRKYSKTSFQDGLNGWRMVRHADYLTGGARLHVERLLIVDPQRRLGVNGADEVEGASMVCWYRVGEKVTATEAAFIPQVTDPESTWTTSTRVVPFFNLFEDDQPVPTTQSSLQTERCWYRCSNILRLFQSHEEDVMLQLQQKTSLVPSPSRTCRYSNKPMTI